MIFGFAILLVALLLSGVAAYYSVAGLVAIFSAATIPVIIMGGSLELGKIAATVWLHNNWRRAGWAFKFYLVPAVTFLMLLTSMGIFGYLSKAHSDQSLVSGDATAKIAIYDEKIRTERDNIDANRKALKQLDEAVDQVMGRSSDERGAERAVQIRRSQQAERGRLLKEIGESQKRITTLNEERAPLAAEFRKVEAEVGPIKYIAALVYGDSADQNVLEKAVRFVIIMIVLVFDPLALTLILAANKQFEWARQGRGGWAHADSTQDEMQKFQQELDLKRQTAKALDAGTDLPGHTTAIKDPHEPGWMFDKQKYAYLFRGDFWKKPVGWVSVEPQVARPEFVDHPAPVEDDEIDSESNVLVKEAIKQWKTEHPDSTLKEQRKLLARGDIEELPWMLTIPVSDTFGDELPTAIRRGDTHVLTKHVPHQVYKWNGRTWMQVDKIANDSYTTNTAYIALLIQNLESGHYDPELLTESEREQVANQLSGKV